MITLSPITGEPARFLFEETVLGRHKARYFSDDSIGYIFVETPHWLDEAYSSAIATTDTGIVMRNVQNVRRVSSILARGPFGKVRGVDLGGGYGLFVRGMRDAGHEFFWQDKYADNLVARGFEAEQGTAYDVAVAFEVLEHLTHPAEFLAEMRATYGFRTCFFTATVFEPGAVPPRDWWYWAFESGQHVSFFSRRALTEIGKRLGMQLFHFHHDLYGFSELDLSRIVGRPGPLAWLTYRLRRPRSLTDSDHAKMRQRLRDQGPR